MSELTKRENLLLIVCGGRKYRDKDRVWQHSVEIAAICAEEWERCLFTPKRPAWFDGESAQFKEGWCQAVVAYRNALRALDDEVKE